MGSSYFLVDCGPPLAPSNGSLEIYTNTTEGSEVSYHCNPHFVPEGRFTAVCNGSEWSPNPADLNCTAGMSYEDTVCSVVNQARL